MHSLLLVSSLDLKMNLTLNQKKDELELDVGDRYVMIEIPDIVSVEKV